MEKVKNHPNVNLKRLLDNLQTHQEALILHAQKDEITNNLSLYSGNFSFKEDSCGLYLVSRVQG